MTEVVCVVPDGTLTRGPLLNLPRRPRLSAVRSPIEFFGTRLHDGRLHLQLKRERGPCSIRGPRSSDKPFCKNP